MGKQSSTCAALPRRRPTAAAARPSSCRRHRRRRSSEQPSARHVANPQRGSLSLPFCSRRAMCGAASRCRQRGSGHDHDGTTMYPLHYRGCCWSFAPKGWVACDRRCEWALATQRRQNRKPKNQIKISETMVTHAKSTQHLRATFPRATQPRLQHTRRDYDAPTRSKNTHTHHRTSMFASFDESSSVVAPEVRPRAGAKRLVFPSTFFAAKLIASSIS
jgi:hypothetical protein